jgi:ascorbate-specific PTS system EIIC-type component UlaA
MNRLKIELKWAFIFMAMMLVWMVLERITGLHDVHLDKHEIYTNFVAIPAILIYVLALRDKREKFYGGTMSYGQGVISGLIITLVVTIFTPLTQYITSTLITPDYFNNVIKYAVGLGKMTQDEAEAYFNLKNYILQSTMFAPIMGIVTTLIVAIFVKKK